MLAAIIETAELYVLGVTHALRDEGYTVIATRDVARLEQLSVLDLIVAGLHGQDDLSVIRECLADADRAPSCVALLSDGFRPYILDCAPAGVAVLAHYTCRLETLHTAIRAALSGQPFVDEIVGSWMLAAPRDRSTDAGLSDREREVAQLLLSDMTRDEIARALFVSPNTIKYHTAHVYAKLGVRSRRGLRYILGAPVAPARRGDES